MDGLGLLVKLERWVDPATLEHVVRVRWSPLELEHVRLDPVDRRLLAECSEPDATVADVLLGLQTLAFRLEQQGEPVVQVPAGPLSDVAVERGREQRGPGDVQGVPFS